MSAPQAEPGKALSYEVYAPGDAIRRQSPTVRGNVVGQRPSLALRVVLVLLGVCVVFAVAAAVIVVNAEDTKPKAHVPEGFPPAPLPSSSVDLALSPVPTFDLPPDPPPESTADLALPPPKPKTGSPRPVATSPPRAGNPHAPPPNPYSR